MACRGTKHKEISSCTFAESHEQYLQNELIYNQLTILYKFDLGTVVNTAICALITALVAER